MHALIGYELTEIAPILDNVRDFLSRRCNKGPIHASGISSKMNDPCILAVVLILQLECRKQNSTYIARRKPLR